MEQQVEVTLRETITEFVNVDGDLVQRVRKLVDRALDEAELMLEFGLADQKLVIIRTLLSASTRNIGRDFTTTENEARLAVDRLFTSMREAPEVIDAPSTPALAPRVDDSDEGFDN